MTTTNKINAQKNVTNVRFFVLFVFLLLSSVGAFAQNNPTTATIQKNTEAVTTENAVASASMDFAIWFMGTTNKETNETSAVVSKKALLNSGIKTNNVLIRSILKKVSVQGNGLA